MHQQLVWPMKKYIFHKNYQNIIVAPTSSMLTPKTTPSPYRQNFTLPSPSFPCQPLKWLPNNATPHSAYLLDCHAMLRTAKPWYYITPYFTALSYELTCSTVHYTNSLCFALPYIALSSFAVPEKGNP